MKLKVIKQETVQPCDNADMKISFLDKPKMYISRD